MMSVTSPLNEVPSVFAQDWMTVSGGHVLYVEQRGAPDGVPVLVVHGGPGSGCSAAMARIFDPGRYRVILLDQRGAGRSQGPAPALNGPGANTTALLLEDMDVLRQRLGLSRWLLAGGSWGATLALLYAASHPAAVAGLLLRNPFLARREDLEWFFGGARHAHPEAWARWMAVGAPADERQLLRWLQASFQQNDAEGLVPAMAAWQNWEAALAHAGQPAAPSVDWAKLARKYQLQLHYFRHDCFLPPRAVLAAAATLHGMPVEVLQGLCDEVCPPVATRLLLQALPASRCHWVAGVGHDPFAPMMLRATHAALEALLRQWEGKKLADGAIRSCNQA